MTVELPTGYVDILENMVEAAKLWDPLNHAAIFREWDYSKCANVELSSSTLWEFG